MSLKKNITVAGTSGRFYSTSTASVPIELTSGQLIKEIKKTWNKKSKKEKMDILSGERDRDIEIDVVTGIIENWLMDNMEMINNEVLKKARNNITPRNLILRIIIEDAHYMGMRVKLSVK